MFLFEVSWIVNAFNHHLHYKTTALGNIEIERFEPE